MNIIKHLAKVLPALVIMSCFVACHSESTSSSAVNADSASTTAPAMNNVVQDTGQTGPRGGAAMSAQDNSKSTGTSGSDDNGNSGTGAATNSSTGTHSGNAARETRNAGTGTSMQVGPHATTVLSGERTGVTPQGVKKGRDYVPRDSVNNRTGLAPPK